MPYEHNSVFSQCCHSQFLLLFIRQMYFCLVSKIQSSIDPLRRPHRVFFSPVVACSTKNQGGKGNVWADDVLRIEKSEVWRNSTRFAGLSSYENNNLGHFPYKSPPLSYPSYDIAKICRCLNKFNFPKFNLLA